MKAPARNLPAQRRTVHLQRGRTPDRRWLAKTRAAANTARRHKHDMRRRLDACLARRASRAWVRIATAYDVPFYVLVTYESTDEAKQAAIEGDVIRPWIEDGHGTYLAHHNDDTLAIVPANLEKLHHVAELLRAEHGDIVAFSPGERRSDAHFVAPCDYAVIPAGPTLSTALQEAR